MATSNDLLDDVPDTKFRRATLELKPASSNPSRTASPSFGDMCTHPHIARPTHRSTFSDTLSGLDLPCTPPTPEECGLGFYTEEGLKRSFYHQPPIGGDGRRGSWPCGSVSQPHPRLQFFSVRAGTLSRAVVQCRSLLDAELDGNMRRVWVLTLINHWDLELERLVVLCDLSLLLVKYDFILLRPRHCTRLPLRDLSNAVLGELVYPQHSLVPVLSHIAGGVAGLLHTLLLPQIRSIASLIRGEHGADDTHTDPAVEPLSDVRRDVNINPSVNPNSNPYLNPDSNPDLKSDSRTNSKVDSESCSNFNSNLHSHPDQKLDLSSDLKFDSNSYSNSDPNLHYYTNPRVNSSTKSNLKSKFNPESNPNLNPNGGVRSNNDSNPNLNQNSNPTLTTSEAEGSFSSLDTTFSRSRHLPGLRLFTEPLTSDDAKKEDDGGMDKNTTWYQRWNPFCSNMPYVTLTCHPLYWGASVQEAPTYDVGDLALHLRLALASSDFLCRLRVAPVFRASIDRKTVEIGHEITTEDHDMTQPTMKHSSQERSHECDNEKDKSGPQDKDKNAESSFLEKDKKSKANHQNAEKIKKDTQQAKDVILNEHETNEKYENDQLNNAEHYDQTEDDQAYQLEVDNYVGLASLLHNAAQLGYFKTRGKVSF